MTNLVSVLTEEEEEEEEVGGGEEKCRLQFQLDGSIPLLFKAAINVFKVR